MAHRLLIQVAVTGAQVFGRAFGEAYRQAAAQTAKQTAAQAARANPGGISTAEACQILNIDPKEILEEKVDSLYSYLFDVNLKDKGGSFYLQSKIYWAKELLKGELEYAKKVREELESKGDAPAVDAKLPGADGKLP